MKITIYTITNCPFSKQEKEYLHQNNLEFEEKDLETDKKYLAEMLAVSNNFAGTPVTKIEKDNGQVIILKGFTKTEFDKALGLSTMPQSAPPVESDPLQPVKTVSPPPSSMPSAPPTPVSPPALSETPPSPPMPEPTEPVKPTEPISAPVEPTLTTTPKDVSETDPQVNDLLAQLKSKASLNPTPLTDEPTPTIDSSEPVLPKPSLQSEPSIMPPPPASSQESVSNNLSSNDPLSKIDIPDIK